MTAYSPATADTDSMTSDFLSSGSESSCTVKGRHVSLIGDVGTKKVRNSLGGASRTAIVSDLLPLALHALSRSPEHQMTPLYVLQCNYEDEASGNDADLGQFLDQHAGESLVWMPVAANASLLINALRRALPVSGDSRLANMTMLYVGDVGVRQALQQLCQACGMTFCFQAAF
ncbi:hypothetical protein [Thalassolituus sp.]|uniref:hypothetical protein n=1 Tax=Thalassolituus sp. TaxID=2030822 RepID=UPI002437CE6D